MKPLFALLPKPVLVAGYVALGLLVVVSLLAGYCWTRSAAFASLDDEPSRLAWGKAALSFTGMALSGWILAVCAVWLARAAQWFIDGAG